MAFTEFTTTPRPHLQVRSLDFEFDILVAMSSSTEASSRSDKESIEDAGGLVDKCLKDDQAFYDLSGLLRVTTHSKHC